jgi:hypothetical protein
MANAFSHYDVQGAAEPLRARAAALVDLGIGAFLAILAWPFPVMRIVLTDAAGSVALGWVVHVVLLLTFMAIADGLYIAVITVLLKRTAGMYLQDLAFREGDLDWRAALAAAPGWVTSGVAGLVGAVGPATAFAKRRLGSTRAA